MNDLAQMMMFGGMGGDLGFDDDDMEGSIEMAMLKAMMQGGMVDLDDLEGMEKEI